MLNKDRSHYHKKVSEVEQTLKELKGLLKEVNDKATKETAPNFPNIYILGCARSGTTLLFQLLCKYLDVTYPTNFLSRFSYAPYIGAKIQYLMNDLDDKKELLSTYADFDLTSNLGKTKGPLAPHEFWYYWRSIFDIDNLGYVKNMNKKNISSFHDGIDSIKSVFKKPMVLKGMIANTSISKIVKNRPDDIIIYIKREIEYNAQSLYKSRLKYFNDPSKWYSFCIPTQEKYYSPIHEVVSQVEITNRLIEDEVKKIPTHQLIECNYENIGEKLIPILTDISKRLNIDFKDPNVQEISNKNSIQLEYEEWNQLQSFISKK